MTRDYNFGQKILPGVDIREYSTYRPFPPLPYKHPTSFYTPTNATAQKQILYGYLDIRSTDQVRFDTFIVASLHLRHLRHRPHSVLLRPIPRPQVLLRGYLSSSGIQ